MRLRFWGTRGSVPTPGPNTVRYGGNTSCVELRGADSELVIFDAGTGLRELGIRLAEENRGAPMDVHLLLSHLHWDHIQGLPFFRPAYDARTTLTIYGPGSAEHSLRELLGLGMDDPFFPVELDTLPARLKVRQLDGEAVGIGGLRIESVPCFHPSPCVAYRVDDGVRSVVYATDTEDPFSGRANPVIALAQGADVLIHDAQYVPEDLKPGWGHSTVDAAVDVAMRAGVGHLVLYHHDPDRGDEALDDVGRRAARLVRDRAGTMKVSVAHEGLEMLLR
jgi:phosphoribosyl 1,2-cyclic phosphodiesterase